MLPFEWARAFVDDELLKDMAPGVVRFRDWRSIGAVVSPFRWKPAFLRRDNLNEPGPESPGPFTRGALEFRELPAVPIVWLLAVRGYLSRFACSLLGQAHNHDGLQWGRPVHRFDPFVAPPKPRAEALAQTYELGGGEITQKMRIRAAWYMGENEESRLREMKCVTEFYGVRSDIVHNRKRNASAERYHEAFGKGFDIAARTLFKLLDEGPPGDWDKLVAAGD